MEIVISEESMDKKNIYSVAETCQALRNQDWLTKFLQMNGAIVVFSGRTLYMVHSRLSLSAAASPFQSISRHAIRASSQQRDLVLPGTGNVKSISPTPLRLPAKSS